VVIAAHTGISKATCLRYVQEFREGGMAAVTDNRTRNGTARKTTEDQDIAIIADVLADVHKPASRVPARLGLGVSD
jgi:transposase